jgi:hypothetical protein
MKDIDDIKMHRATIKKYVLLLLKFSYMFRRLLRHPEEEIYRKLKTIVTVFDYSSSAVLYIGLQLLFTII